jgi:hypothetical protein
MSEWIGLAHNGRLCVQILRRYPVLSTDLMTIPQRASFCTHKDFSVVRYSVLHGSEQLFASKYKLVLPIEEELRKELDRERAELSGA